MGTDSSAPALKQPTEQNLQTIAAEIKWLAREDDEETSVLMDHLTIYQTGRDLGFELTDEDGQKVRELVLQRFEIEYEREKAAMEQKFQAAIHEIWPVCVDCKSTDIKPRFSENHQYSDHIVVGGPSNDRHWETLDHLFCGNCGRVYYTEKVEQLEARWTSGEFTAKSKVPQRQRRGRC